MIVLTEKLIAYGQLMRVEKPVGWLLLSWCSLWGLWLAGEGRPPAKMVVIFLLGSFLMRSAGCVFNDLADRNFDGYVERTNKRPLVRGAVSSIEAGMLGVCLLFLSFLLVLMLNWQSIVMSFFCVAMALLYPFCKRFLPTPQAVLGICFSSAILLAHTAILGRITLASVFFFLAGVAWALIYDTYYALVDREDDLSIGLKSSAIFSQNRELPFLGLMSVMMIIFLIIGGWLQGISNGYYLGILIAVCCFIYEIYSCRHLDREKCFAAFWHNNWVGASIFLGLVLSYLP